MKILYYSLIFLFFSIIAGIGYFFVFKASNKNHRNLFKTEKVVRKTIKHVVQVSGLLEIKDLMRVGSLQDGIVSDIFVKENDKVKKGQLLATIDTGYSDADVLAAKNRVIKAQKELDYQTKHFRRQEALFKAGQLSRDAYQNLKKDYEKALHDVLVEQATLKRSSQQFASTKVCAPESGIVLAIYGTKGMVKTGFQNVTLFDIAHDITKMNATLDIDESDIGHIKLGQKITLTSNSFPDMPIKSTILDVGYIPKDTQQNSNSSTKSDQQTYKAHAEINNEKGLLRPGMVLNATIKIQSAKNVLSVNGLAFYINQESLEKIAKKLKKSFSAISKQDQKKLKLSAPNDIIKYVWVKEQSGFVQKAVTVGITDSMSWEIKKGLNENDEILIDVEEPNEMDEVYSQWFKGAL